MQVPHASFFVATEGVSLEPVCAGPLGVSLLYMCVFELGGMPRCLQVLIVRLPLRQTPIHVRVSCSLYFLCTITALL